MNRDEALSHFKYALKLMIELSVHNIVKERIVCTYAIKGIDFLDLNIDVNEIRTVTYSMIRFMVLIINMHKNFMQVPNIPPLKPDEITYDEYRKYYDEYVVNITKEVIYLRNKANDQNIHKHTD